MTEAKDFYHEIDNVKKAELMKPGGVVFAAYVISDGCLLDKGFKRGNISVPEYMEQGLIAHLTFAIKSQPKDLFELVCKENINDLMSVFPVSQVHYAAADGCTLFMHKVIDAFDNDAFELYLKYHFAAVNEKIYWALQVMPLTYSKNNRIQTIER